MQKTAITETGGLTAIEPSLIPPPGRLTNGVRLRASISNPSPCRHTDEAAASLFATLAGPITDVRGGNVHLGLELFPPSVLPLLYPTDQRRQFGDLADQALLFPSSAQFDIVLRARWLGLASQRGFGRASMLHQSLKFSDGACGS